MTSTYLVCAAPGTHLASTPPVHSRHRTLRAAVAAARRSDRLAVYVRDHATGRAAWLWQPPQRNHPRYGHGRYGVGPLRGEPTLPECVALCAERVAQRTVGGAP